MAKQYMFAFTARPAEFGNGFVTVAFSLRGQHLAVSINHRQQIIEIVRHAAGEPTDGVEPL